MTDVTVIARCPLFAGLEIEALAWIAGQAAVVHYAPGDALCRADEPAEHCWMLTAGLVDVLGGGSGRVHRGSRISTAVNVRPVNRGASWRRIVSTSGSSGTGASR